MSLAEGEVHLEDGRSLAYDVLIVATGARLVPEETQGMTGSGWLEQPVSTQSNTLMLKQR